ncbi:MAG: sulfatase-like hydrolase/transferase [Burkholderiales bacterium]|nr:sulfatase-like hydrolase/transferase [Burkholderiales bacterium]
MSRTEGAAGSPPRRGDARPPNLLLITSDQHRGDCLGVEGRRVHTPHLDLLAAQGTRFSACITPNVVCMPARASMLTGLLPLTHGTHDNGIDLDEAVAERGFAGTLARAGYATAFIGKAHFSSNHSAEPTGRCENLLSSHRFADEWHGPYMGFQHVELMQLGHNHWLPERAPGGLHYERWYHGDGQGELKDRLYRQRLPPETTAAQTHHSALPAAWHNSTWVGDRAGEYLHEQARRQRAAGVPPAPRAPPAQAAHAAQAAQAAQAGQAVQPAQPAQPVEPFCAWISLADPHHPFDAPAPWCWMHRPEDVDLPPHRVRDLERRPWWHRAALENTPQGGTARDRCVREQYSRMPPQSDAQLRELIASYFGMIALVDHQVGRLLAVLHDEGLQQDTLVIFSSDHGDWLGDHGLVLKGPMFYEGLLRVPLIVRGPGVPAGRVVANPVSTIDLAATFADYAGVPIEAARHSRSLRPLIEAEGTPPAVAAAPGTGREHAFTDWRLGPQRCGVALDLRGVRTREAKLTLELGSGAGELYDLRDDPHECVNRFGDPQRRGLRDELLQRLMSRPADILDPLPMPVGPA